MASMTTGRPSPHRVSNPYGRYRMCAGKVQFPTDEEAMAELLMQQTHRPHWRWSLYDCLWCDFIHIGRHGTADGHDQACRSACERKNVHDREYRRIEGTW